MAAGLRGSQCEVFIPIRIPHQENRGPEGSSRLPRAPQCSPREEPGSEAGPAQLRVGFYPPGGLTGGRKGCGGPEGARTETRGAAEIRHGLALLSGRLQRDPVIG